MTVRERTSSPIAKVQTFVHHLPAPGVLEECTGDCDWHEVVCGGGIGMPGPFEPVAEQDVCRDCAAGRVTFIEQQQPRRRPRRSPTRKSS